MIEERELALARQHPRATELRRLGPYRGALASPEAYAALPESDRDTIVRWAEVRRQLALGGIDRDPANLADPLISFARLRAHVLAGERLATRGASPDPPEVTDGGDLIALVARIRGLA